MKKRLLNLMFTALTLSSLASLNAVAKTDTSVILTEIGGVMLQSEDIDANAVQLTIDIEPVNEGETINDVSFNFNFENSDIKVYEYRVNDDKNQVNIYIADSKPLFSVDMDTLDIGTIFATDADGNKVNVQLKLPENALKLVSNDELDEEKDFESVKGFASQESLEKNGGTRLKLTSSTGYQIVIPSGNYTLEAGQTFAAGFRKANVEPGTELKLSVESKNGWKLKDESIGTDANAIAYQMKCVPGDNTILSDFLETIVTVDESTEEKLTHLTVEGVDAPLTAGKFTDTLTFHVTIDKVDSE